MIIFGGREDLVAQWITKDFVIKHSGFFKEAVIGPGEYALIIKNGRIEDIITQEKLKRLGGVWQRFLRRLGGGEDLQLLIVDTRPKKIIISFEGYSADRFRITGGIEITLRISPEKAVKIIKLMQGITILDWKWRFNEEIMMKELTLEDVRRKLESDAKAIIYTHVISQHKAEDFHKNIKKIMEEMDNAMDSLRAYWMEYGVEIINFNAGFGDNEYEKVMRAAAEAELYQKERDIEFFRLIGDAKREEELKREIMKFQHQTDVLQVYNKYDLEKEIINHEIELQKIAKEFEREMELGDILHEEKLVDVDERIRGKRIIGSTERLKIQKDAEAYIRMIDISLKDMEERKKMEREKEELDHDVELLDKIVDIKGKKVKQKIEFGKEVEIPKTQILADVEKEKAKYDAEKAKHSLDLYRQALEEERKRRLEEERMEIEKFKVITGKGSNETLPLDKIRCPYCNNIIPSNSIYCPVCGHQIRGGNGR